jgi:hypothetical protein
MVERENPGQSPGLNMFIGRRCFFGFDILAVTGILWYYVKWIEKYNGGDLRGVY